MRLHRIGTMSFFRLTAHFFGGSTRETTRAIKNLRGDDCRLFLFYFRIRSTYGDQW